MQSLEAEDQVKLTDVFEESVQRLDEDLNEVDQGKRGFGRRRDEDEVKGRVMSICDLRRYVRGSRIAIGCEEGR